MSAVNCSIFVYGTLKPGERYHDRYCGNQVVGSEPACVPGRLYHLSPGYPGLTHEPGWVRGVLLHFDTPEVLVELDELEGYTPGCSGTDNMYERTWEQIYRLDRTPLTWAWLYRMEPERVASLDGIWIPEGYWLDPSDRSEG
jgi:gamma-glutamylcyclotransferase (GGCT)/AIG2-like uncharacterized protein YtfP